MAVRILTHSLPCVLVYTRELEAELAAYWRHFFSEM